jgi:hypothetical protein
LCPSEMALFRNLGVNQQAWLCGVLNCMPPPNPLISLILRKITHFRIGHNLKSHKNSSGLFQT